jgi:hypothetical protein
VTLVALVTKKLTAGPDGAVALSLLQLATGRRRIRSRERLIVLPFWPSLYARLELSAGPIR